MTQLMLIDANHPEETRVVACKGDRIEEYDAVTSTKEQIKGNIYLAKITRVEPSLQAAFVEYGGNRQGFLPFAEIHPNYYQIPTADREALMKQAAQESRQPDEDSEEGDEDSVETLDEDSGIKDKGRNYSFLKKYKVQEVIKKGQVLLIQVIKEERGNKGAALSTYISLPGRYCVLMPNSMNAGGVSRKIRDAADRRRLRDTLNKLALPSSMSVIIRTAGGGRSRAEVKRDLTYLQKLWNTIREETLAATAPALIYQESDIIKRSLRDLYNPDIEAIMVEGEEAYKDAKNFMKLIMPSHAAKVKLYKDDIPLFYKYNVESKLLAMHDTQVSLPSGGYLVINATEALVAVDVNSGRSTKERNVEQTALATNIEAAREIARQLRLRDLAGLLVIDFIDMYEFKNRRKVEQALKEALSQDRAKIQVGKISTFGLLEMSRQRLRPSVAESNMHTCPSCRGLGVVRAVESLALQLIRALENAATHDRYTTLHVLTQPTIAFYILNHKRTQLHGIEDRFKLLIDVREDPDMQRPGYVIACREHNSQLRMVDDLGNWIEDKQQLRMLSERLGKGPITERQDQPRAAVKIDTAIEMPQEEETASDDDEDFTPQRREFNGPREEGERGERNGRRRGRRRRGGRNRDRFNRDRNYENRPEGEEGAAEQQQHVHQEAAQASADASATSENDGGKPRRHSLYRRPRRDGREREYGETQGNENASQNASAPAPMEAVSASASSEMKEEVSPRPRRGRRPVVETPAESIVPSVTEDSVKAKPARRAPRKETTAAPDSIAEPKPKATRSRKPKPGGEDVTAAPAKPVRAPRAARAKATPTKDNVTAMPSEPASPAQPTRSGWWNKA